MKFPKEMILRGTDNDGIRHRYTFEKSPSFKPGILKFLKDLGLDPKDENKRYFYLEDSNCDEGCDSVTVLEPADITDTCWRFKNKKYDLDIFWGKEKVILLVRTSQKMRAEKRRKIVNALIENSKWNQSRIKKKAIKNSKLKVVNNRSKK